MNRDKELLKKLKNEIPILEKKIIEIKELIRENKRLINIIK